MYKGMTAGWEDLNLSKSSDVIFAKCNGAVLNTPVPRSSKKAMNSPEKDLWLKACTKEIDSMKEKAVWTLVEQPKHKNVICGLWLIKVKYNVDGTVNNYKPCYFAVSNTQRKGKDYGKMFSPTGKLALFRRLVAIAAIHG